MDFCPNYPLCAWAHVDRKTALFTRLRCGMWTCEYCAAKNASIWRAFLLTKLPDVADDWWLMTLTAHSNMRSGTASLENLRSNFDRIMKRIRRVFGDVEYVRVYEKHPTSAGIHAHVIISGISPYVVPGCAKNLQACFLAVLERTGKTGVWAVRTWLKKTAQECQIGYIADIRPITGDVSFAIHYVAKYLTKSQQELNAKGLRHVQTSRKIGSPKNASDHKWKVGSFVTARDFNAGQQVVDLQTGEIIPPDYWCEVDKYPPESV